MNSLTKVLLEDLLEAEDKKITAIYGGGFKPPTKGHYAVIEKAAEQDPEIDDIIIYVGGGERDGITQGESIQVWELYKKYLPLKVRIEPSKAPVGDVLRYAKEHPEEEVLWIIGARENNPEDFADIASRTRTIDKYPNLQLRVIQTAGGVSGTAARKSIKDNNKEQFFHLIPDIPEKEQVWDIVSPVIKEGLVSDLKSKFNKFISAVKQENKETKEAVSLLIKSAKGDVDLTDEHKKEIGNQLKDVLKLIGLTAIATLPGGFIAAALIKLFKVEHLVTPNSMMNEVGEANLKPYKWEEIDAEGYYVYTRFITDSETQYDVDIKSTIYFPEGQMESRPALEIEFSAKPKGAEGSSAKIVVNKGEMYRVMSTIVNIIKKYIKKSRAEAIIYSPSKKSSEENFGTQRDNLYRAFISKAFPGTTFKQSGDFITAILPSVNEGTCGYDTDVTTGKKLDTPGGLEEGKQVGPLYHYTSADGLKSILQSNKIKGSFMYEVNEKELYGVSTTRNKNFQYDPQRTNVRITLDGDKLSNNYKITPRDYWERQYNIPDNPQTVDEDEEVILTPKGYIDNIKNYILSIDKVEDLQEGRKKKPDPKKGTGKKPERSGRRLYTDEDPKDTVRIKFKTKEDIVDTLNKKQFKAKSHARQSQVINLIHQRVRAAYGKAKDPEVRSRLKRALDYIEKRKEASKKKTERLRKMKEASDPQAGTALPYGSGFAPVKELMTATDIICDSCGWKWAIKDGGNDLFMCHKCGHDNTPKSDPFGLKAYARELVNDLKEEITKSDLNQIEKIADEWFEDYGIDVEFTYHFLERVNDPRNGKPISAEELEDLFIKTAEKYGKKLSDFPDNFEAVLNDLRTSINLPFALNYDARNDEMDLVAKTIMRKRDFKTTSPKLPLEELGKAKKGH